MEKIKMPLLPLFVLFPDNFNDINELQISSSIISKWLINKCGTAAFPPIGKGLTSKSNRKQARSFNRNIINLYPTIYIYIYYSSDITARMEIHFLSLYLSFVPILYTKTLLKLWKENNREAGLLGNSVLYDFS